MIQSDKKIVSRAISKVGKVREKNEDAYYISEDSRLLGVFDGIGSLRGGGVAAQCSRDLLEKSQHQIYHHQSPVESLRQYFIQADQSIQTIGNKHIELMGLGCTGIICFITPSVHQDYRYKLNIANLGDTRVYLHRDGQLIQLGMDQSWYQMQIREGFQPSITEEEKYKNAITSGLGMGRPEEIDFYDFFLKDGDSLLMSTDGLHGYASHQEINHIINMAFKENKLPGQILKVQDQILETLCDKVYAQGAPDNITIVYATIGYPKEAGSHQEKWILGDHKTSSLSQPAPLKEILQSHPKELCFLSSTSGKSFYLSDRIKASGIQNGEDEIVVAQIQNPNKFNNLEIEKKSSKNWIVVSVVLILLLASGYWFLNSQSISDVSNSTKVVDTFEQPTVNQKPDIEDANLKAKEFLQQFFVQKNTQNPSLDDLKSAKELLYNAYSFLSENDVSAVYIKENLLIVEVLSYFYGNGLTAVENLPKLLSELEPSRENPYIALFMAYAYDKILRDQIKAEEILTASVVSSPMYLDTQVYLEIMKAAKGDVNLHRLLAIVYSLDKDYKAHFQPESYVFYNRNILLITENSLAVFVSQAPDLSSKILFDCLFHGGQCPAIDENKQVKDPLYSQKIAVMKKIESLKLDLNQNIEANKLAETLALFDSFESESQFNAYILFGIARLMELNQSPKQEILDILKKATLKDPYFKPVQDALLKESTIDIKL